MMWWDFFAYVGIACCITTVIAAVIFWGAKPWAERRW